MRKRHLVPLVAMLSLAGVHTSRSPAPADFKAAYAKAEAANKQAGALKNQWTPTARRSLRQEGGDAGKYDEADRARPPRRGARQGVDRAGQGAGGGLDAGRDPLTTCGPEERRECGGAIY